MSILFGQIVVSGRAKGHESLMKTNFKLACKLRGR